MSVNRIPVPNAAPTVKGEGRYRLPPGDCSYCDANRTDPAMPPHDASARCESGRHPHCTCGVCY